MPYTFYKIIFCYLSNLYIGFLIKKLTLQGQRANMNLKVLILAVITTLVVATPIVSLRF